MSDEGHLNQAALNELKDIMEDDFALLVTTFIDDSILRVSDLSSAVSNGDADLLRETAHSFKGSSGNICAPALEGLCKELESMGKENQLENASVYLAKVQQEFNCVKSALEGLIGN